jgi:hypothetical protein
MDISSAQAVFSDGLLVFTALTLRLGSFDAFHALPNTPHILLRARHEIPGDFFGEN